jgi:hypothetical protein
MHRLRRSESRFINVKIPWEQPMGHSRQLGQMKEPQDSNSQSGPPADLAIRAFRCSSYNCCGVLIEKPRHQQGLGDEILVSLIFLFFSFFVVFFVDLWKPFCVSVVGDSFSLDFLNLIRSLAIGTGFKPQYLLHLQ